MERNQSYYELLEVEPFAESGKIKAAFRRLARKHHPDMNPGRPESETLFKRISEAYAVLSDPQKRAAYDRALGLTRKESPADAGAQASQAQRSSAAKPASGGPAKRERGQKASPGTRGDGREQNVGMPPHIENPGAGFKEMFDTLFRKAPMKSDALADSAVRGSTDGNSANKRPVRGEDITVEMPIAREEANSGVTRTVNVQHTELCRRCSGTGRVNSLSCPVCNGEKQLVAVRRIEVRVPAGVKEGSKVRVSKEGGRGSFGGEPGDLFLVVRIEQDQRLKIDGATVSCELPISITEAVLGAEVEVPTLHGAVKMTIPPLTSSGKVFRLKKQGVSLNGSTGDQLVTVQIVSPKALSNRERELYEELARLQKDSLRGS